MSEKPIIFSSEMVKAILDGRKVQTRRVVKPQPIDGASLWPNELSHVEWWEIVENPKYYASCRVVPYAPGDHLWVRETWATWAGLDHLKPSKIGNAAIWYKDGTVTGNEYLNGNRGKWRPSIFMPRWASRITLKVTVVRVERVQDISEEDAKAEGISHIGDWVNDPTWRPGDFIGYPDYSDELPFACDNARHSFQTLWDSINGKRKDRSGKRLPYAWADNPWVFVVEFRLTPMIK